MGNVFASFADTARSAEGRCCTEDLHVLLVDDIPTRRAERHLALHRQGFEVRAVGSAARVVDVVHSPWVADLVVVDLREGDIISLAVIDLLRMTRPWLPALIVGTSGPEERPAARDPSVLTRWLTGPVPAVRLSAAIIDASCRVDDRLRCPFHRLLTPTAPARPRAPIVIRSAPGP